MMETNDSSRDEVLRVLNFWWTLESLNFSEIPKLDAAKHVRAVRSEQDWPWKTGRYLPQREGKKEFTWRHVVFLGVAQSGRLVEETFEHFKETIPDVGGKLKNGSTAMAVLVVDEAGRIPLKDQATGEAEVDGREGVAPASPALVKGRSPSISPDSIVFSTLPWALARLKALAQGHAWESNSYAALCDEALDDIEARFAASDVPMNSSSIVLTLARAAEILNAWIDATKWKGQWNEVARVQSIRMRVRDGQAKKDPPL